MKKLPDNFLYDEVDADLLSEFKYIINNGYVRRRYLVHGVKTSDGRTKRVAGHFHRDVMARVLGRELNSKDIVDHIDGNTLNNLRSNLRICNYSGNAMNSCKRKHSKMPYIGVRLQHPHGNHAKRWTARIRIEKKETWLGYFQCPILAAIARDNAARLHHGEFARTTMPVIK